MEKVLISFEAFENYCLKIEKSLNELEGYTAQYRVKHIPHRLFNILSWKSTMLSILKLLIAQRNSS